MFFKRKSIVVFYSLSAKLAVLMFFIPKIYSKNIDIRSIDNFDEFSTLSIEKPRSNKSDEREDLFNEIRLTRNMITKIMKGANLNKSHMIKSEATKKHDFETESMNKPSNISKNTDYKAKKQIKSELSSEDSSFTDYDDDQEEGYFENIKEDPKILADDEQTKLVKELMLMKMEDVYKEVHSMFSKSSINPSAFFDSPLSYQVQMGVLLTRFFFSKKKIKEELFKFVGFMKCNLYFELTDIKIPISVKTKNGTNEQKMKIHQKQIIVIERDQPLDPSLEYKFNYSLLQLFQHHYNHYSSQMDVLFHPLRRILDDLEQSRKGQQENFNYLENQTGKKIEVELRKNENLFNSIVKSNFQSNSEMIEIIRNIDCNLKDMMAFYDLLPRFFLVYKRIKNKLETNENPLVMHYTEQLVDIHSRWLSNTNSMFGYIGAFNTWQILNKSIYMLIHGFPKENIFKKNIIEIMSQILIELTIEKDNYKYAINQHMNTYKNLYKELRVFFEGIEEVLYIKVPFKFPKLDLTKSIMTLGSLWFTLLFYLIFYMN